MGNMTDSELADSLIGFAEWEVAMRRAGRLRDAVAYRRLARDIGKQIMERVNEGSWQRGLTHVPNDEPSSR